MGYSLVYPILVVVFGRMGVGQNREIDEEHNKDCVEERLQFARVKFDRGGAGSRKTVWGIVISIFQVDQNWN